MSIVYRSFKPSVTSFRDWMNEFAYVGKGTTEGTVEEAMLHFFYDGISPWIRSFGYRWDTTEEIVSQKFLKFCYDIYITLKMESKSKTFTLLAPEPRHRNLEEDRDTFDMMVDMNSLTELLRQWSFRDEIVGTKYDYLIREFCYLWIDVRRGRPGNWTQIALDANDELIGSDDERNALPDGNWSRTKHDLY